MTAKMNTKLSNLYVFLCAVIFIKLTNVLTQDIFLSNVDNQCLRCLCFAATKCDLLRGCIDGYCGPYKISRIYWVDAGKIVLPEDDANRTGAWEDCALNYECAQNVVKSYLVKYAKDCNGDKVVNCEDYSMINFNGGVLCHQPLKRNKPGRDWLERYFSCFPPTPDAKYN